MKKSILHAFLIILLININVFAQSDKYSKGYQIGWEKGYCYESGYGCTSPIPPLSPLPRIDESSDNYQDGYNRGFFDGQRVKTNSSSQNFNQYTPADFGEFKDPIDVNFVSQVLRKKQQNYNIKRNSEYQKEVSKAINSSIELYNEVLKYLIEHENLFKWANDYQNNLDTYYNPTKIVQKYPSQITYKQAGNLVGELQENYNATLETFQNLGKITQTFIDNPNNILEGYYEVQSIEDLVYNESKNSYEHLKSVASNGTGDSYLFFDKNNIRFKRPESTYKTSALKFDKLENGYYKFQDGHGQMIMITKDNVFLNYYYEPNSKGTYTKMTSYLVMNGFNFTK